MLFYLIIAAYQNVRKFLKFAKTKSSNIPPLNYRKYLIIFMIITCHVIKGLHPIKNNNDKMQCVKEIDVTNENLNEEPTDQSGFSLVFKSSETKSPKPSITGVFPSLCLLSN